MNKRAIYGLVVFFVIISGIPGLLVSQCEDNSRRDVAQLRNQIHMGMTEEDVLSAIGSPEKKQMTEATNPINGTKITTEYWYYSGTNLQLVFDEMKLTGINQL